MHTRSSRSGVRRILWILAAVAMIMAVMPLAGSAAGTPGDTIEGPGVYMDNVWITTSTGQAVYLAQAGVAPNVTYGAPNGSLSVKNGCIDYYGTVGEGFGDLGRVHDYTFEFKETVSDFSLRMLDFGDYNPDRATSHKVVMIAYDTDDTPVAWDTLEYTSDGLVNPRSSAEFGDLYLTGDACDRAVDGRTDPGNWIFDVAAPGIAKVTLEVVVGRDPNIAFTDMDFTPDGVCVEEGFTGEEYEVTLLAGQNIDAGTVTVSFDADMIYVVFDTSYPWLLSETHVAVGDVADFPTTKKGNPIPGKFPYSETHDPAVGIHTYEIPWTGDFPVDVAAHAALVDPAYIAANANVGEVDEVGPFYATSVVDNNLGYRTWTDSYRIDPLNALEAPDWVAGTADGFYSLGLNSASNPVGIPDGSVGDITVAFDGWVLNGEGDDISVHEVTNGRDTYPSETADVYGWYADEWYLLGSVANDDQYVGEDPGVGLVDLGELPYVEKVKIVDTSLVGDFTGRVYDGYDVDAVDAKALYYGAAETGWGDGDTFDGANNWGMWFEYDGVGCVWPTP